MKECDLYAPLKSYLEAQGYRVKGEIGHCDVAAVRGGEEPLVVELKLSINLKAVLQAVQRLSITPTVYVGVASNCRTLARDRKHIVKLFRMLGLGLISINPRARTHRVAVLLDPGEYRPRCVKRQRQRMLGEFERRVGDPNPGGVDRRRGIMTSYRQRALAIAHFLRENGAAKASVVAAAVEDPKAREILYRDVYGWFQRQDKGIYELSPRGKKEIPQWSCCCEE